MNPRPLRSASNAYRWIACPGSPRMEDGLVSEDSEYSLNGKKEHAFYWMPKATILPEYQEGLPAESQECIDTANSYTEKFFEDVRQQFGIPDNEPFVDNKEVELFFKDSKGAALFPGHADLIREWPRYNASAIADLKTGYSEMEEAANDYQLSTYAVMERQSSSNNRIAVALIRPRAFGNRFSSAVYEGSGLLAAEMVIEAGYKASLKPDAPLHAGKHCHFCKAKSKCEEYQREFGQLEPIAQTAIAGLPDEKLAILYRVIKRSKELEKEVIQEVGARIESGAMKGRFKSNGSTRTIKPDHSGDVFGAFMDKYQGRMSALAYDDCRALSWGRIEELVQKIEGCSQKRAKEIVKELTEPFVDTEEKAKTPILEE